jgi:hypothetical protein
LSYEVLAGNTADCTTLSDGSSLGPNDRLRLMYQGSRAVF